MLVPKLVLDSWNRVNARINDFCDHDLENSTKVLFVTDVHIGAENRHHIKQLQFIQELIKLNPVDFIVNGGDIGLDVGESDDESKEVIEITKNNTQFNVPYLLIKGNHDFSKNVISDTQFNEVLNQWFLNIKDKTICDFVNKENSNSYGYFIDKTTNTKFLFLNTSEQYREYVIGKEQLEYVIDQLEQNTMQNLVILSHYCINKCGEWVKYPVQDKPEIATLKMVLKDFVEKKSGTANGYTWNFENSKGKLRLYLSGDSHFNNKSTQDGYLITCRQGSGGCDVENLPSGAIQDIFDKNEQCNFDILVINKKNQMKLFRVGEGEIKLDLEIK